MGATRESGVCLHPYGQLHTSFRMEQLEQYRQREDRFLFRVQMFRPWQWSQKACPLVNEIVRCWSVPVSDDSFHRSTTLLDTCPRPAFHFAQLPCTSISVVEVYCSSVTERLKLGVQEAELETWCRLTAFHAMSIQVTLSSNVQVNSLYARREEDGAPARSGMSIVSHFVYYRSFTFICWCPATRNSLEVMKSMVKSCETIMVQNSYPSTGQMGKYRRYDWQVWYSFM